MEQQSAWLPIGYEAVPGTITGRMIEMRPKYQILEASGHAARLLIAPAVVASRWIFAQLLDAHLFSQVEFGALKLMAFASEGQCLNSLARLERPKDVNEALAFAISVRRTMERIPDVNLADSVYVEKYAVLLPVETLEEKLTPEIVLGRYLTGGVHIPCTNLRRISAFIPWLSREDLELLSGKLGSGFRTEATKGRGPGSAPLAKSPQGKTVTTAGKAREFCLVGRSFLETFFREHVIDVVENVNRYEKLGVGFPGGIVLRGPPGCGKTFAVERLVEYLDWPCFTIDSGSIGSPYIHETGKKIAEVFDKAIEQAPSVLVIDEMEAFLADRESGGWHRVEEVAEFLRRIPQAIDRHVLIIGMTNRPEMIDPALLRRGRFDHVVEVSMASKEEVEALLRDLLSQRPCDDDLPITEAVSFLTERPLSDVAFLIREGARLAARAGKDRIDSASVFAAIKSPAFENKGRESSGKIGFI